MGYMTTDNPPRGEVCFWSPSIMPGYYKNPEKTSEAFHDDWLLSGDVGLIKPNGALKIIDRAKNIFKLSQGEYIAPEKLENIYIQSPFVLQCFIHGDSLRDYVVGVFVLDPDQLQKHGGDHTKDEFRQKVFNDLYNLAAQKKLTSLEKPK